MNWKTLSPESNRKLRIYLVTLSAALVAIGIGIAVNLQIRNLLAENLLEEFAKQEGLVAEQVAQNMEINIEAVEDKLRIAATLPEVIDAAGNDCQKNLRSVFAVMENKVGNLGRVNSDGIFSCSMNSALIGVKANTLGDYIDRIFQKDDHPAVMSRAIKVPGVEGHLAAVHVPVYRDGLFDGTLGGAVYFSELKDKLLEDIKFADSGFVVLFDDNGDILYHPEEYLIGQNLDSDDARDFYSTNLLNTIKSAPSHKSGSVRYTANGVDKIGAFHTGEILEGRKWVALVTVPVSEAEQVLTAVGLDNGFMAFSVVMVVAIFAITVAALIGRLKSLEVDQAKDVFLQLATHQLQTPTTGVQKNLELLLDGTLGKLTNEQRNVIQDASEENAREIRLVKDMLNVARLDSGRLTLTPTQTNISDLMQKIIKEQQQTIKERGQTLEQDIAENISANVDPDKIFMAIENLISNASKYTKKTGKLRVSVEAIGEMVQITVSDNGVGIDKSDQKKLFGKFNRIDNELSAEVGGTGLGLYLVKRIIELHKGRILVESKVGEGSKFIVRLPKN